MKKLLYVLSLATVTLLSGCQKELPAGVKKGISITVSSENSFTKSAYNSATGSTQGQFTWSKGDKIGVHAWVKASGYNWPEPLTLVAADDGKTTGTFKNDDFDTENNKFGYVAFYPWNGMNNGDSNSNGTNVNEGTLYVHLKPSIDYYNVSGNPQQLLPLAAKIDDETDKDITGIQFKHLGAGIMVKLKEVPAKANNVTLTVTGQNITGWFSISPNSIGSSSIASTSGSNSTVSILFPSSDEERSPMTFVFPVPTLTFSAFTLKVYRDSEELWSKSASNSSSFTLSRGDILNMGELTVPVPESRTISVGVISYLISEIGTSNWTIHYWDSIAADGDVTLVATGSTSQKALGDSYWSNAAQTFTMFEAEIPEDASFKIKNGSRWFGEDASSNDTKAYIFNYSGDKAIYE